MKINQNCRFFSPDTPCIFHKREKVRCENCKYYQPVKKKILIIKRDASGDVLRTTSILEPLKKKFQNSSIVWFTETENREILEGNPLIDKIWTPDIYGISGLLYFKFDIMINLDLSHESLLIAGMVNAWKKYGFWYKKDGKISFSNKSAREWFYLSHDDEKKKKNLKTYQQFIKEIAELDHFGEIIVPLDEKSKKYAEDFVKRHGIYGKKIIGVNVGSGRKWITKRWPEENILKFISLIGNSYPVIIFGGKEEKEIMERIVEKSKISVINSGWNNPVKTFFALLNLCDVVVTADTLALHAAIGLKKKVVALFGPTSLSEIEMYGRGLKIKAPVECYCCYKRECSLYPMCMERIKPEDVFKAVKKLLNGK